MKKIYFGLLCLLSLMWMACQQSPATEQAEAMFEEDRAEAREDSLELVAAFERQSQIEHKVYPSFETDAIASGASLDAADDPAVWIHPDDPAGSLIIGSNKKGGLHIYDLSGQEVAFAPVGNINNVDVLSPVQIGDKMINLVGGSNRSDQSIDLFHLNPEGPSLENIAAGALAVDTSEIDDIYGFCLYQDPKNEQIYAFINGKNGRVQQFALNPTESGNLSATKVRDLTFRSQVEGMVADPEYGILYVGEEDKGIWKLGANPASQEEVKLIAMSGEDNPNISFDVEGLTIYEEGKEGYLIASSQGNFSYAVFDRQGENEYLGSFVVAAADLVDGSEETDGIQAISASLGDTYPQGIFIAQDGFNYAGDSLVPQNFKVVDWRNIAAIFSPNP